MTTRFYALAFILISLSTAMQASPFIPEDVLSKEEIEAILTEKNFFLRKDPGLEQEESRTTFYKKYAQPFLRERSKEYSLADVLKKVLSDSIPLNYKMEELYRARLQPQVALGQLIPSLDVQLRFDPISSANNLFGFLLPQNWLELASSQKAYKVTQFLFLKLLLDESLSAELLFLKIHKMIQEFETISFYATHLTLFARSLSPNLPAYRTIQGRFALLETQIASRRLELRLLFNQLAMNMSLLMDESGSYGVEQINIKSLELIPDLKSQFSNFQTHYPKKHDFIKKALERSVEVRAFQELYQISKQKVGVTASADILQQTEGGLNLHLGYGTLPKVLIARSQSRSSELDLQLESLKLIDFCRRAHDTLLENIQIYEESARSLALNTEAFKADLEDTIERDTPIDPFFLNSFNQILETQIQKNQSWHEAMMALAITRRLLVVEESMVLQYLPATELIHDALNTFIKTFQSDLNHDTLLDGLLRTMHKTSVLKKLLDERTWENKSGEFHTFDQAELVRGIKRNLPYLLYRDWIFFKSAQFYKALRAYLKQEQIELSKSQQDLLNKFCLGIIKSGTVFSKPTF
ncbi:MAG: hypothetical protein KA436_04795 [Oligoflexales bacterium]|nr:hypothetical protein [Oligoflexales bacterium]